MRLDKFLSETNTLSRSEAKNAAKKGLISVNGVPEKDPGRNISETEDEIRYKNRIIKYQKFYYFVLNKPAGYVCSTNEADGIPAINLLPKELQKRLNPVGRLDKGTTGLLLFTDDGILAHELLSPQNHAPKTYFVTLERAVTEEDLKKLENGVNMGDNEISLPAEAKYGENESEIYLTICEGKFHQVKRMFKAVCNKVVTLKRISFAGLSLDELNIKEGEGHLLSDEEIKLLSTKGTV